MKKVIYPYKMGSASAKLLGQALGLIRVYPDGKFKPNGGDVVINWGNSNTNLPTWNHGNCKVLNDFAMVGSATNKLSAFTKMLEKGVPIPEFTTSVDEVKEWLEGNHTVIGRFKLTGHSGEGIVIFDDTDNLLAAAKAPLYTKYVKKKNEYRVHVFMGKVIDVAQKKLQKGIEVPDYKVRNHKGGWIYAREGVSPPQAVFDAALKAIEALGLHFGAVDIGWNDHYQQAVVYEVNSAPGLTGTTLYNYATAFGQELGLEVKIPKPPIVDEAMDQFVI